MIDSSIWSGDRSGVSLVWSGDRMGLSSVWAGDRMGVNSVWSGGPGGRVQGLTLLRSSTL